MQKYYLRLSLGLAILSAVAFQSCKKENGIDNNTVIQKPYGLFVGSSKGELFNTNDGVLYTSLFPPDDYAPRAIVTSGNNILWIKGNVHFSENNGKNFNVSYSLANPFARWQQMILDVPGHERLYLSSIQIPSGVVYSDDNGKRWLVDAAWGEGVIGGLISSFTQLKNGLLFSFSDRNDSLYRRDNKDASWVHVKPKTTMPKASYLSHFNNILVLTDSSGTNGVHYSLDSGQSWTAYQGLPAAKLLATNAPFEKVLLVGTDSMGIYRLENGKFVPANNGLEDKTSVYGITGKDLVYKNGVSKSYIYIATSTGLYRSEDLGFSWALMKPGDYRAVY